MIPEHVNKYENIMLINVMKFDGLTLKMVRTNQSRKHNCSFQASWFKYYSTWLEYSPTKDLAYCLLCFVFHNPNGVVGQNTFTIGGFRNLTNSLMLYVENDIASTFSLDSIIDDFEYLKDRRVLFS